MSTTIPKESYLFQETDKPRNDKKLRKILKRVQSSIKYDTAIASAIIEAKYLNHGPVPLWSLPNELFWAYHAGLVILGTLSTLASEGKSFFEWDKEHKLRSIGKNTMKLTKNVAIWLLVQDPTTQAVHNYISNEPFLQYSNWVEHRYPSVRFLGEPIIPSTTLPRYLLLLASIASAIKLAENYSDIKTNIMGIYDQAKKNLDYLTERVESYIPQKLKSLNTKLKNKMFPYILEV